MCAKIMTTFGARWMMERMRNSAGYSLVEVVVAMAVIVIGLLALLPMLALNMKSNVAARTYSIANLLAHQKLETVKSWPLYDDYGASGPWGITSNNTDLFASESNITVNNWFVYFGRTTTLVHNGYGDLDCNGISFDGSSGIIIVDEGAFNNGAALGMTMNTEDVNPCGGGGYRGEDFKLIKVTVDWDDVFGYHKLTRHMFISRF